MFYFDTGSDDDDFGYMYCEWDENPALMAIRRTLEKSIRELIERLKPFGPVEAPNENEIQRGLDALMVKADALLKEYALVMFFQAQGQLVADVTLKVFEEMMEKTVIQPVNESQKMVPFSMADEGMQAVKEVRKNLSEFFKTRHNELIGVKRGRQAQISIDQFLETLRRLPLNARWPRIVAEVGVAQRTLQEMLKRAGIKSLREAKTLAKNAQE